MLGQPSFVFLYGPVYRPALWMTASNAPSVFASLANCLVCEISDRSATRQVSASGQAAFASWARCSFLACKTTEWPRLTRARAVREPSPSEEPVISIRPIPSRRGMYKIQARGGDGTIQTATGMNTLVWSRLWSTLIIARCFNRHSVRSWLDSPRHDPQRAQLKKILQECTAYSAVHLLRRSVFAKGVIDSTVSIF